MWLGSLGGGRVRRQDRSRRHAHEQGPTCEHPQVAPVAGCVIFGAGHAPIGWTVGFLRAPFDRVLAANLAWRREHLPGIEETALAVPFPDALLALAPIQTPPTREILARTAGNEWTANLVNSHLGGDSCSSYLSGMLACEAIVATNIPVGQYPFPATSFTMTAPRAPGPLHQLRYVGAGKYDSGRWTFRESGEPQPFEERERYTARRIRERFDREMLLRYLGALGIHADDPPLLVGGSRRKHRVRFTPRTSTLDEVRRAYGIE
jgi:hypothetical protein